MRRRLPSLVLILAAILTASTCPGQRYGTLPDGHPLTTLAPPGTKAVVLFFVASDCPISNRTFPEMQRLRLQFTSRHVRFWFVYPNQGEALHEIQQHQAVYDSGGELLLDPAGALTRLTAAIVTPEAAVLIPDGSGWKPVSTGRIDDRYRSLGRERPQATAHFTEQTLLAVLNGTPLPPSSGTPVGCAIVGPYSAR